MKVLIAEDDPSSRRLLERFACSLGHEVCVTADGEGAWSRFEAGDFNFVLTDWIMPGLDGLELCRRIRTAERHNYVYVIVVTSHDSPEELSLVMSAGADDLLAKPLDRRALQGRMRAAERILKLHQELSEKNRLLEEANNRLRLLSRIDALMQIGNRLAFEEAITELHARTLRYGDAYGVVMCDVDHFKAFNDRHGHPAGDEVLRRVAAAVRNCLRSSDSAYRYGGEELVVLLPKQSLENAAITAERLRAAVEALQLSRHDGGADHHVTISCGAAACCSSKSSEILRWETVLQWADEALYCAKACGRNRVELAESCPSLLVV